MAIPTGLLECTVKAAAEGTNWDAISAGGTVAAVIAALWIAGAEGRRLKREGRARAVWVREEFRKPIGLWVTNAKGALGLINLGQDHNLLLLLSKPDDRCYPLRIPAQIVDLRGYLHDLGDAGQYVATAVGLARRLEDCDILAVLKNQYRDHNEALDIRAEFTDDLKALIRALEKAQTNLKVDGYQGATRRHARRRIREIVR
ncbi:hypothetical protein [Stenotrophomonas sp.]|uniref:hypothetical protein n=1 Tax=Stenotrophomonas sp. TaxID=69392 RepID=UPI0028B10A49|nr:hypothetical protein [Stenotrophomonas sp.]